VDVRRTAALLAWLGRDCAARKPALEEAIVDRFVRDRMTYSDVLEASCSFDGDRALFYRFSYAFPGFRADPEGVGRTLLELSRLTGAHVEEACRTVLRAARRPAVDQLLFGFAHDGDARQRAKLYLQFHPAAGRAAVDLASQMIGCPVPWTGTQLHMLCLDVGEAGLACAKLYFTIERVAVDDVPSLAGPVPLVDALAPLGVSELRNVLLVHRVTDPSAGWPGPVEFDFPLADNGLSWGDLRESAPVKALVGPCAAFGALFTEFRLTVRFASASIGHAGKLNVYYALTEVEDPETADGGAAPAGQ
jgi:hypothetical protein